jgi:hypothetical protein
MGPGVARAGKCPGEREVNASVTRSLARAMRAA